MTTTSLLPTLRRTKMTCLIDKGAFDPGDRQECLGGMLLMRNNPERSQSGVARSIVGYSLLDALVD